MATWLVFLPMRMPAGLVVCVLPADQLVAGMWVWSFIVDAVVASGGIVLEVCNQPVFPYVVMLIKGIVLDMACAIPRVTTLIWLWM